MENSITRDIANQARKRFISTITAKANSMYYKTQGVSVPATGDDIPAPVMLLMSDIGLNVGDIVIPSSNPEYMDEVITGIFVNRLVDDDGNIVGGFKTEDDIDLSCDDLGLDILCDICFQFENNWKKMYNK